MADAVRSLPIGTLVTSDLARARDTASIIGKKLNLAWVEDAGLRERNFGLAQGGPLGELRPEWSGIDAGRVVDAEARPPGGESLQDLSRRIATFFSRLAQVEHDGDVLVVTHGGVIRVALAQCDWVPVARMTWGDVTQRRHLVVRFPRDLSTRPASGHRSTVRSDHMRPTALELPARASKPRVTGLTMMVDGGLPTRASRTSWRAGPSTSIS